jgi:hypothetical protein
LRCGEESIIAGLTCKGWTMTVQLVGHDRDAVTDKRDSREAP